MITRLLIIGTETLYEKRFDFKRLFILLEDKGCGISDFTAVNNTDEADKYISALSEPSFIIAAGNVNVFYKAFERHNFTLTEASGIFKFGKHTFVLVNKYSEKQIIEKIIPIIAEQNRTKYNTVIFKTFGKKIDELKELVGNQIKNNNKITFGFYPDGDACDVRIRYSTSVKSEILTELIERVAALLGDSVYALKDISLCEAVAQLLLESGKRLSIAESFTGGGLAASLVALPGISATFVESLVTYSNSSKIVRLGVPESIIKQFGAVSADAAFEMANGLLNNQDCDIAVATTGNAGPTAEGNGEVGLYYIAVGDRNVIHVFEKHHKVGPELKIGTDIRAEIIKSGIDTALFEVIKYIKNISRR